MSLQQINVLSKKVPYLIRVFFLIDVGFMITYLIAHFFGESHVFISRLFDLDDEFSLPSWYSSIQFFSVFILSSIFTYHKIKDNRKSLLLIVLPLIFLFCSIDETVQIHESLGYISDSLLSSGNRKDSSFPITGIWMFILAPIFLIFFLLFIHLLKKHFHDKQLSLKKLLIGMFIMLIGAAGVETLVNFIGEDFRFIEILLEEGLEMIGVTIMLWAFYDLIIDYVSIN